MYFVDRQRIEDILSYLTEQYQLVNTKEAWNSPLEKLALERILHVVIEGVLDVGNQVIDGFIMRDPGSYEDIVDILVDEKVIPESDQEAYKVLVQERKSLVQEYDHMDHEHIMGLLKTYLNTWGKFPGYVRDFLHRELGPVSAFKPETGK